ncbi:D-beta-hydroxybutyrate dehydrogenase-like [Mytilus trossulus]|uniref:D-beta-hydroxybutyrate dehydrogenase-like n=1 Tax=Mytilus trossulus TaxID=6551 RepID=UPI0030053D8E
MEGKVAVVTGSTTGIGLGIARHLANLGCNVILTGLGGATLIDGLVEEFTRKYAGKTYFVACDLTKEDEINTFCSNICSIFPEGIDILVNNAGIQFTASIENYPLDTWNNMMAVGLTAPFLLIQEFLPKMKKKGWGRIVNMASMMGIISGPELAAYSACKSALIGLTKGVALEAARHGVTCNVVCPGYSDAPIFYHKIEKHAAANSLSFDCAKGELFSTLNPHKKPITVQEIAELVSFLCTSGADSMTCSPILMDAGNTIK